MVGRDRGQLRTVALDGLAVLTAALAALPLAAGLLVPGGLAPVDRLAAAAIVVLAAWKPLEAVLLLAALAPIGTAVASVLGSSTSATDWLVPAVLLGAALAIARGRLSTRDVPEWLVAAALALAWLSLASVAVQVIRDRVWFETAEAWRAATGAFLSDAFFTGRSRWRTATAGFLLAEQALLVPIVASLALEAGAGVRLASMFAAGATGAAMQNAFRVVEAAIRTGEPAASLFAIAARARISAAFPDANAAGSYFVLAVLVIVGLSRREWAAGRRRAAAGWGAALLVTGTALYLTGSRVALAVVLPVAALAWLATVHRRAPVTRRGLALAALAGAATVALVATAQARRPVNDAPRAVLIRMEFVGTTWRMLADHPIFGVGSGAFRKTSGRYSSDALKRYYPTQNAHNNFLQVAGELGPLGLAALLLLVGLPVWRAFGTVRGRGDPLALGLWGGVAAFLLTCLGGHPLLVPEVAASFVVALGLLTAAAGPSAREPRPRWRAAALAGLALVLVASVPLRGGGERGFTELEHVTPSQARWRAQADGGSTVRFRSSVAFYVRPLGQRTTLELRPVRRLRQPVDVTLRVDGRPINIVRLQGPDWQAIPIVVPRMSRRAFAVLRLEAAYAGPATRADPVLDLRRPERAR